MRCAIATMRDFAGLVTGKLRDICTKVLCAQALRDQTFHFTPLKTLPREALSALGQWHQISSFLLTQITFDLSFMYQTAPELMRKTSKSRSDCDLATTSCRGQSYTRMFRRSITRPLGKAGHKWMSCCLGGRSMATTRMRSLAKNVDLSRLEMVYPQCLEHLQG